MIPYYNAKISVNKHEAWLVEILQLFLDSPCLDGMPYWTKFLWDECTLRTSDTTRKAHTKSKATQPSIIEAWLGQIIANKCIINLHNARCYGVGSCHMGLFSSFSKGCGLLEPICSSIACQETGKSDTRFGVCWKSEGSLVLFKRLRILVLWHHEVLGVSNPLFFRIIRTWMGGRS